MIKINSEQLYNVKGGAIKWGVLAGIGAFTSFIIGVIDGLTNPQKCNR